ncbi:MAG: phage tail protein [Chloroflexota bacterium]
MPPTGQRVDPLSTFRFHVEMGGITQAVFSECSGLEAETEVFTYNEGGLNEYVHKLPGRTKISDLTLKRGVTFSNELWQWYAKVIRGKIERQNVSVILYDSTGTQRMRWQFREAYPIKWTGPAFKADENAVAIETLTLAHKGMELG